MPQLVPQHGPVLREAAPETARYPGAQPTRRSPSDNVGSLSSVDTTLRSVRTAPGLRPVPSICPWSDTYGLPPPPPTLRIAPHRSAGGTRPFTNVWKAPPARPPTRSISWVSRSFLDVDEPVLAPKSRNTRKQPKSVLNTRKQMPLSLRIRDRGVRIRGARSRKDCEFGGRKFRIGKGGSTISAI